MQQEALRATRRDLLGTRPTKRLRRDGRVPGIVYGSDIDPIAIHVAERDLYTVLHTEAGLNAIIEIDVDGQSVLTVAREIYRHPVRGEINHVDFIQVSLDTEIEAEVHVEFVGAPVGVAEDAGILQVLEPSVTITALPNAIPSSITLDISGMAVHDTLTVGDLPDIEGVTYVAEAGYAIVTVILPAAEVEEVPELLEGEEGELLEEGEAASVGDEDAEDEG